MKLDGISGSTINLGYWIDDKYIIQQFTGLKDSNEKDVYEGDILKYNVWEDYDGHKLHNQIFSVLWNDGMFAWQLYIGKEVWCRGSDLTSDFKFEIIGNIYENPELVKEH